MAKRLVQKSRMGLEFAQRTLVERGARITICLNTPEMRQKMGVELPHLPDASEHNSQVLHPVFILVHMHDAGKILDFQAGSTLKEYLQDKNTDRSIDGLFRTPKGRRFAKNFVLRYFVLR